MASGQKFEYTLSEIAAFMIKNGADIRLTDNKQRNVYHYISKYGTLDLLKVVMKEDNNLRDKWVDTNRQNEIYQNQRIKKSLTLSKYTEMSRISSGDVIAFRTPQSDEKNLKIQKMKAVLIEILILKLN